MYKNIVNLFIFFLLTCTYQANATHSKNSKLKNLNKEIKQLQTTIKSDKNEKYKLHKKLKKTETQIGKLSNQLNVTRKTLKYKIQKLNKLKKKSKTLNSNLMKQYELLAQQIKAYYQLGKNETLKSILNQENTKQVHIILQYYHYFYDARKKLINKSSKTLNKVIQTQKDIESKTKELQKLLSKKKRNVNIIANTRKERQIVLNKINNNIKNKQQKLQALIKNKINLEKLIRRINEKRIKAAHSFQAFSKRKGKLPKPLSGKIITKFKSLIDNQNIISNGIILAAKQNQKVKSIYHGKVAFADWMQGYGLLIIIDHGGGFMSLYAHNRSLSKKVGDTVKPKTIIARAGNSGGLNNNRLYFEIRRNGKVLNPEKWLNLGVT